MNKSKDEKYLLALKLKTMKMLDIGEWDIKSDSAFYTYTKGDIKKYYNHVISNPPKNIIHEKVESWPLKISPRVCKKE